MHDMEQLPPFFERMNAVFASERSNAFLLTGAIEDLVDARSLGEDWLPLPEFLHRRLARRDHLVLRYDIGHGIRFTSSSERRSLAAAWQQAQGSRLDRVLAEARQDPSRAIAVLAALALLPLARPVSVLIEHAGLLVPAAPAGQLHDSDRRRLALLCDWLADPRFHAGRGALVILAETAATVHERLRAAPQLVSIAAPLPDRSTRRAFLDAAVAEEGLSLAEDPDRLATCTAGLSLHDLRALVRDARWRGQPLDRAAILSRVNELLHARIGNHITLIEPSWGMDAVCGQGPLKRELERQRQLLAGDDPELCPVGILCAGPNGCGKTWIFQAWAASCGRLVVQLSNLRGSYFGETDRIFEQVKAVLEALGQVIILIDEADTQFAAPSDQQHETENRLFGSLIRMMGDPANRGHLVWILLTARPERLAPDLKRAGRCGLHLPVFPPQGADLDAFIERALLRGGLDFADLAPASQDRLRHHCTGRVPAEFDELGRQIAAARALGEPVDEAGLLRLLDDIPPADPPLSRAEQILQAQAHCSRRSLLPKAKAGA